MKNYELRITNYKKLCTVFLLIPFLIATREAFAAAPNLGIVPPIGLIRSGETVAVNIRVDSAGENINAAEGVLSYPVDRLRLVRISREESVFTLWTEEPAADTERGTITFTGGRPGGIVADNAALLTVYFEAYKSGEAVLAFDTNATALYKNDGEGTRIPILLQPITLAVTDSLVEGITLSSATHPTSDTWSRGGRIEVSWQVVAGAHYSYQLSNDSQSVPDDTPEATAGTVTYDNLSDGIYFFVIKERPEGGEWSSVTQRRFLLDATPPEPFTIVQPDPSAVSNAPIIAWTTTDATSGIARYDLTVNGSDPVPVQSPLTLDPSWLGKTLTITAVDAAGNTTTSTVQSTARQRNRGITQPLLFTGIAIMVLALFSGIAVSMRERRRQ